MDRSKRAIRTPKRFDDEAFETPPKPQQPVKLVEAAKPTPEPTQAKSIIKVKLNKVKPRGPIITAKPTKEATNLKDIPAPKELKELVKPKELAKPKELPKIKDTPKPKETPKPNLTPKLKETPKPKETPKTPKDTPKPKEPVKPKELAKPKDLVKLKEFPKIEIKTPERDSQLVYRPKTKRPRTLPVFADVIPNVVLPFWDARTAAEDHEDDNVKELVHCHCGIDEELGLMVQCETCLTWQHAHCLSIDKPEDVPDGYTCKACSDPKFARESMKWAYDQDWLTKGKMKQFSCDPNSIPEKNINILRQINNLIGNVLNIHQLLHSLRVKSRLLMNARDDDPELKLFRNHWPAASTISVNGETPDDCRANLRLNIQKTEEFIGIELGQISEQLATLEKECSSDRTGTIEKSLDSLKNDLQTMKKYIARAI